MHIGKVDGLECLLSLLEHLLCVPCFNLLVSIT